MDKISLLIEWGDYILLGVYGDVETGSTDSSRADCYLSTNVPEKLKSEIHYL